MSSESGGGEAGDGGQNLIGRFGPSKWFRLLVVDDDEFADGRFQKKTCSVTLLCAKLNSRVSVSNRLEAQHPLRPCLRLENCCAVDCSS
jgi:hypothetical protein